jgi:hypothetical protein
MRVFVFLLTGLLACPALAHSDSTAKPIPEPEPQKISAHDTVSVTVEAAPGKNQVRLDVFVVNTEPVAGMPLPFKVTAANAKMKFDSVLYAGGRVEYFQLKAHNADTANQTLLVGLIADLSGSKPPLAPGRGKALSIFYTGSAAVTPEQVTVEPVVLAPANKLEFNTIESDQTVGSTVPTYVRAKAAKAAPADKK